MEKPIVVRLKKGKKTFEALTHHGAVELWRAKRADWSTVLVAEAVFKARESRCSLLCSGSTFPLFFFKLRFFFFFSSFLSTEQ